MSSSDPSSVLAALKRAQDAVEMAGRGRAEFEHGISADADWKTQLTKACRLLEVVATLRDFRDHQFSCERAHQPGLFERQTTEEMKDLSDENRAESYYGGGRPTKEQADAMTELAIAVHQFAVSHIREGVCLCD